MKRLLCGGLIAGLMVHANDIENPFQKEAHEVVDFLCKDRDGFSACRDLNMLIRGAARMYAYRYQNAKNNDEKEYHLNQIFKHMMLITYDPLDETVRLKVKLLAEQKNIDEGRQSQMIDVIENNLKAQGFQLDKRLDMQEQLKERKSKGIWGYFSKD
jgi:hypothetical protein